MLRRRFILLLAALAVSLALSAPAAEASPSGCTGGKVSAIDQYCETIPTPTGGQSAGPGSPTLATTLPHRVVVELARRGPLRSLLGLPSTVGYGRQTSHRRLAQHASPAGQPAGPAGSTGARKTISAASAQSLSLDLILILIGIGVAMIAIAVARRWLPRGKSSS